MTLFNKLIGNNTLKSYVKFDFFLLLAGILLQQVHPMYTSWIFALIIIMDFQHRKMYAFANFYTLMAILIFILFSYNGYTNGNLTVHNAIWSSLPSILGVIIGHNFSLKVNDSNSIYLLLFFFALFLALPHLTITLQDIMKSGLINPQRGLSIYGYDEIQRAITARTVEMSLSISGISALFLRKSKAPAKLTTLFIIVAVLAELCTIHFVSRTGLTLFLLALAIGFLYRTRSTKQILLYLCLFIVLYYAFQESSLSSLFADREIEGSTISDAGGRLEKWILAFTLLLSHPHGYSAQFYAHNFWLDFGKVGGLLSFFILSLYSLLLLVKTIMLQKVSKIVFYNRFMILVFSITFIAALFTEPVHRGAPAYMDMYFLFADYVDGLSKLYKR